MSQLQQTKSARLNNISESLTGTSRETLEARLLTLKYRRAAEKAAFNAQCFRDAQGRPQQNNWHHLEWFIKAERYQRLLLEAAREHSKTQIFAITQPLAEIADNHNIRILLISDVHEKSQERTRVLREHIEKNADYKSKAPHVKIVRQDGDHKFWIKRDYYWLKEATVTSTYAGAPVSGGRYDIIIADDLVNYLLNANTPGKRRKMARWWNDDVMNSVADGGKVWVIGTHQHYEDLYEELKHDPAFHVAVYPAVDEEDTGYGHLAYAERNARHGIAGDDARVLWPQMHSYAEHMGKKNNPSTHDSYLRQQQQLAVPETGLVYRKPLMDAALERGKHVAYDPDAAQFLGVDPGYGQRAAMLAIQERAGDVVELWAEHSFTQLGDDDIADVVVEHCRRYKVQAIFIDAADPGLAKKLANELYAAGLSTLVQPVPFSKYKRRSIKATRWMLQCGRLSWGAESTTVHRPGRKTVEPSLFREEISAYALKEGEDDEPMKGNDHGPDAWTAYAAKWISVWLNATEQE